MQTQQCIPDGLGVCRLHDLMRGQFHFNSLICAMFVWTVRAHTAYPWSLWCNLKILTLGEAYSSKKSEILQKFNIFKHSDAISLCLSTSNHVGMMFTDCFWFRWSVRTLRCPTISLGHDIKYYTNASVGFPVGLLSGVRGILFACTSAVSSRVSQGGGVGLYLRG